MKNTITCAVFTLLFLAGCATGPQTALSRKTLEAGNVIYFEQSDRIPKDVLLAAHNPQEPVVAALNNIPAELVGEVLKQILAIVPETAKNYSEERMFNALLGRRMLFVGYDTPEQLSEIQKIVEGMGGSIEYVTPQEGTRAGTSTNVSTQPPAQPAR